MTLQVFQRDLETVGGQQWPTLPGTLEIQSTSEDSSDYLRVKGAGKFGTVYVGNSAVSEFNRYLTAWVHIDYIDKHLTHPTNHVFVASAYNVDLPAPSMTLAQLKADYLPSWTIWRLAGTNPSGEPFNNIANIANYGFTGSDVPANVSPGNPWTPGGFTITSAVPTLRSQYGSDGMGGVALSPVELEAA